MKGSQNRRRRARRWGRDLGIIWALTTLTAAAPGFRALPIMTGAEPLLVFGLMSTAVSLMQQLGGQQIEIHPLPTENDEQEKAVTDHKV